MTPEEGYKEAIRRVKEAARLDQTELDLSSLNLIEIPSIVFNFETLRSLDLTNNELTHIPDTIEYLYNLRILDLHDNLITEVPDSLCKLINLTTLSLNSNPIYQISDAIGDLVNLKNLFLIGNKITDLPDSIGGLGNLENLYVTHNRLPQIPNAIGKLSKLRSLFLNYNRITRIPDALGSLTELHQLYLNHNRIEHIPNTLEHLTNLRELHLRENNLTQIPKEVGKIRNLRVLDLSENQIAKIPSSFNRLNKLQRLFLQKNPGLGIPSEVLGPWLKSRSSLNAPTALPRDILEYYFRTLKNEHPLNEAKLILVGRGAVGKTSLSKRLITGQFNPKEIKTEGINIDHWEFQIADEQIRLNVWDFGGQEIMHATHQFFLTERSLYLLVLNGRDGGEDAEAEYWLKLVGSFGGNSPVIIVLNKISEHAFDLNRNGLLKKYPNIKAFVRTDCSDNRGIEDLKAAIYKETSDLDELRYKFPSEWFAVKDRLAVTEDNYLTFADYRKLCAENGVEDESDQNLLARFLNQLGIVLNYKDDPRLKDTHVLNPHWVTEGIYKILNAESLEEANGEIRFETVSNILKDKEYPSNMVRFIFDLMKKFDLCFSFPDDDLHYLIPELLPKNEPDEAEKFDPEKNLNFQFNYPILPEGLQPRFITRTHHLSETEPRWRSGVILNFEDCRALVKADGVEKKVTISVAGDNPENRRRLLAVVRADLERIHRDIKNLEPEAGVPLPGLPDDVVPYHDLITMEKNGLVKFPKVVGTEVIEFKIADLLNGVDLSRKLGSELKLFYSYSHNDESLRRELQTHLQILKRSGVINEWSDHLIEAGDNWENEIMKELEDADIILLLISADFIASQFCYEVEMKRALERHRKGEALTIPVIIRDCHWKPADFAELQVLPTGAKAVDLWEKRDTAWRSVTEGIEKAAEKKFGERKRPTK